ncbi:hypothetical protein [Kineococcus sp. SYSU DK005]|uniref:hypothetical protein n=1 Tax=Kineococcus sp. SYSU DK005 TaxID=3383126 RepID=UPI003D7CDCF1
MSERPGGPGGPGGPGEEPLEGLGEDFDFDAAFQREFGPKPPLRSVLVVPVAAARKLAEVCTVAGVRAHVVPVRGVGCVLVTEDPATGEQDAQALSAVVRQAEVLLLTVREESIEGQSWTAGQRGPDPKPGLLLSVWPDEVQRIVLGRVDPAEAAGAAQGGEGSRIGAFWKLFRRDDGRGDAGAPGSPGDPGDPGDDDGREGPGGR